jgi:hypothetical protein
LEEAEAAACQHRQEALDRLVNLLTDEMFQSSFMTEVGDFGALNQNVRAALRKVPGLDGMLVIPGVMRLALEAETLRRRWLNPQEIFETAASSDPERAAEMLQPFGPDLDWRQLAYAVIASLASRGNPDASRRFLSEHAQELGPEHMSYSLLPERLRAHLDGLDEPALIIPYGGPFGGQPLPQIANLELARALVARIGGQLNDNPSAFDNEALRAASTTFSNMDYGVETPTYVVESDSPQLVAIASQNPGEGLELLRKYIAIHGANPYQVYRNRSLYGIAGAVICHPDLTTAMDLLQLLIARALQPGGGEYTEPLHIALTALGAANGDSGAQERLKEMREAAQEAAARLSPGRGSSDSWAHHCRRLAMLAEAFSVSLGDAATAAALLEQARHLPFGYAGFQVPASLTLAEAYRICLPHAVAAISDVRDRAFRSAHKVQEPLFCATTTARVNAMIERWWLFSVSPVDEVVRNFHKDPDHRNFAALHLVGETFRWRGRDDLDMLPIPREMRDARCLQEIAREVYRLPVRELSRVNPRIDPSKRLEDDIWINIPDPGFAPLLAARLSAELLVERDRLAGQAPALLVKLVSAAVTNKTALHLILARLLLMLGPGAANVITVAEELAPKEWMEDSAKPPHGVPV